MATPAHHGIEGAVGAGTARAAAASPAHGRAAALLARLDRRQKIAQLLMPRIGGEYMPSGDPRSEPVRRWIRECGIGGVIVGMGPPLEIAAKLNTLQAGSDIPLLVAADMESGPGRVLTGGVILPHGLENGGGTRFPPLMALGAADDEELAWQLGRITALEARAVGVHVIFAPVADVNSNPGNPIINTRSYGADPQRVARLVAAHVRGIEQNGALATAKHFPGHGDTSTDSHLELPYVDADRERLERTELVPFRAAIHAGAGGVMSGHIAFPAITGDDTPATLHPVLLAGLLRTELRFGGIVFTDALDMGAVVRRYDTAAAVVLALQAGADVLVQVPSQDIDSAITAVLEALEGGSLSDAYVDAAVLRVLHAKERLGLLDGAEVPLARVPEVVGIPAHVRVAREAARRSITLLRDEDRVLPLSGGAAVVIVHTAQHDPLAGAAFIAELEGHLPSVHVLRVDAAAPAVADAGQLGVIEDVARGADVVIFASFTRVAPGVDATATDAALAAAVQRAVEPRALIVVAFGSPYMLAGFPAAGCHVVAWAGWEPMQSAAARVLVGAAQPEGRLPIELPPLHERGAGLRVAAEHAR